MPRDAQGLPLTAASDAAARAHDGVIEAYLKYRLDAPLRLKAAIAEDPDNPLLAVLKGSFALLGYKAAAVPAAQAAAATATRLAAAGTARERAHAAALSAWADDTMDRAFAIWEGILADHPHDILAFRLHHFCAFWTGEAPRMFAAAEAVFPAWDAATPGHASLLGCRAFAHEECGSYLIAEAAGREAVARDPAELWAVHAVAHVLDMQGRRSEGIAWIEGLAPNFEGANNLKHHVFWHQALYHLERRDFARVLALYDHGFRDLASPVTQMQPDLYIDVQNAVSMLYRLGRLGVDVGTRWEELADKAEARIGDTRSAFTLPHWMLALTQAGRLDAARRLLAALRDAAGANASVLAHAALPVCEAALRHAEGDHAGAVAVMRPALGSMHLLGGSHAQQDVLEQLFLEAAIKAGSEADQRLVLERVAGRWPTPPGRRVGYADTARHVHH